MTVQDPNMRGRIKEVAIELLIRNGYQGLRFRDISEHLETPRANIHSHFSTREVLVEEVTVDYLDAAIRHFEGMWQSGGTLEEKILALMGVGPGGICPVAGR
jgi:AcrR family transcriptional regulator